MDLQQIRCISYLENNVLLYCGIRAMYERRKAEPNKETDCAPWPNESSFKSYVEKLREESQKSLEDYDGKPLRQNEFANFFRFLQEDMRVVYGERENDAIILRTARMLCLYDCLKMIAEQSYKEERNSNIPYLFERLCNCMNLIAESNMCYLFLCKNATCTRLANSGYDESVYECALNEADFTEIHSFWEANKAKRGNESEETKTEAKQLPALVGETLFCMNTWKKSEHERNYSNNRILALRLGVPGEEKEKIYIVFQYSENEGALQEPPDAMDATPETAAGALKPVDLNRMRDILFLKERLTKYTGKYINTLILSQATCRYVCPLGAGNRLNILHLTDLHIKATDKSALEPIFSGFPRLYKKTGTPNAENDNSADDDEDTYDLAVITGDVIQGRCSAGEMEENYRVAEKLLFTLAKRLWSYDGGKRLRADWKKRFVIIPGNHDYAAMNELEVVRQKGARNSSAGRAAGKEGGPMVKFAYYIHFLSRFLGVDIGTLVDDGLNSIFYYDQMQLNMLALNTCSGAGPLRNNKVHIDGAYLDKLKKVGRFDSGITICLAHHTENYKPDYAVDRYYTPEAWEKAEACVKEFRKLLALDVSKDRDALKIKLKQLRDMLDSSGFKSDDAFAVDFEHYEKNYLNRTDERCEAIRSAMMRDDNMEKADYSNNKEIFDELKKKTNVKITLGGHIHEVRADVGCDCYEGARFFDNGDYQFAVLSIDIASNKYDWQPCVRGTQTKPSEDKCFKAAQCAQIKVPFK